MTESLAPSPPISSRVLGLAGIVGGAALLAAFPIEINPSANNVRIVLFEVGAIAIVIGVHRRQAAASPSLAVVAAVLAVLANAWALAMFLLGLGRLYPFAGDFGLVYFVAGMAMWLADAAFGFVTLRLGLVSRWGALALAVGSLLAITGIDRLGLTSSANPTIFGPISLAGIALNGTGWILLGIDLVTRGRARPMEASTR